MKRDAQEEHGSEPLLLVRALDQQYARLHQHSLEFARLIPPEKLYLRPREPSGFVQVYSCGEHILRSAATVEQAFGGLTVNLWDDPFEWALPESLRTPALVEGYLCEVEETRSRAFHLFQSDNDLLKEIQLPSGELQVICRLLFDTLRRAAHHQGRAFATLRLVSDVRLPQV